MTVPGTLFVISAPSGGGKTSIIHALCQQDEKLCVSISHTTRAPRVGEQDGVNYFFVDEATFLKEKKAGIFLESAQVFNHNYGTSREWVLKTLNSGKDVILEIDWQGARVVREQLPCVNIFIVPPSEESLRARLESRKQDPKAVIEERMKKAKNEISHYPEYDYVVINEAFQRAVAEVATIINAARLRTEKQKLRHQALLDKLSF